jgi:tRNA U55 pseudouridine synthase TruB
MKRACYWKCMAWDSMKSFNVDIGLHMYKENKDCEEETVEQIATKWQKTSVTVIEDNSVGYVQSVPPVSLTVKKHMHV